jgi:hypothetical protein
MLCILKTGLTKMFEVVKVKILYESKESVMTILKIYKYVMHLNIC